MCDVQTLNATKPLGYLRATMTNVKELICVIAFLHVTKSQQSLTMTWTKYKRIHVQESSWKEMEIGDSELSGEG